MTKYTIVFFENTQKQHENTDEIARLFVFLTLICDHEKNNSKTNVGVRSFQTNLKAALQLCSACGSFAYYKYPKDSDFFIITVKSVCIVSILLFTDDESFCR